MKTNRKDLIVTIAWAMLSANCTKGGFLVNSNDCPPGKVRNSTGTVCISDSAKFGATTCTDVDLTKLIEGTPATMCDGTTGIGLLKTCSEDGQSDCLAKDSYKVVNTATLSTEDIRLNKIVAGVTGSKRDTKVCRNTSNLSMLDMAAYSAYPPSTMPRSINAANFNSATTDEILVGTHSLTDGTPVRLTTNNTLPPQLTAGTTYYVIVRSSTLIRLESSVGAGYINFTSDGMGIHTIWPIGDNAASYFDTIEDYNAGGSTSPGTSPWSALFTCDENNFTNVSAEVVPTNTVPLNATQTFSQVWRDELTGMLVSNVLYEGTPMTRTWPALIKMCESLNGSSAGTDWRIPTQKELMQLHVNGISKVALSGGTTNKSFWSSTRASTVLGQMWTVNLATGGTFSSSDPADPSLAALCIR